ncbi:Protein of unknown function DUF262 [Paenimyroides ummariense]|uniref:GmrSD restriction endonucleases N-terminal domain-containing protein n=1 Tax=Paenimyroides ummariense TaxID=913024 RepID=A0A1I5EQA1_9FLAO|nr:DUF262 domain-containing protein [Paenimyroides ummariense]SFO13678.1 Protein of unknown function DUF262 [Paenimyroides ummariense]
MNILNRNSTTINIANFWENYQLNKYNFEPDYQRKSDVWSPSKKSFLIDTILKNFPIPPIFLHQHIDEETGKTMYDVIDGKQRLGAILSFIKNEIRTPEDFHSDGFGIQELSDISFKDLDESNLSDWKKAFWRYDITIEYIDTNQVDVVNNIFDRLNRNGEPLTKQELRNAKYNSSGFYKLIKKLALTDVLQPVLNKLQRNRLEDEEYITELLITSINKEVIAGDKPEMLDQKIEEYSNSSTDTLQEFENDFIKYSEFIRKLNLNLENLKIDGVSHFYALWGFAIEKLKNNTIDQIDFNNLNQTLEDFYTKYLGKSQEELIQQYKTTMSAGTKSTARRKRRIESLLQYC